MKTGLDRALRTGWLNRIEEAFADLSGRPPMSNEYVVLQSVVEELERKGNAERLPKKKAEEYVRCAMAAFNYLQIAFAPCPPLAAVLVNARRYALAFGDIRSSAILDLQLSVTLMTLNRFDESRQACETGLKIIDALEDAELEEYSGRFLLLYHGLRGEPAKVLEVYKRIRTALTIESDPLVLIHIIPMAAFNARFVGQTQFAKRLLTNARRAAISHGFATIAEHLEGALCSVLLESGSIEEAQKHITFTPGALTERPASVLTFWAERAYAHLLYTQGDLEGSHTHMLNAESVAAKCGLSKGFAFGPAVLVMSRAFYWAKLPPIAGLEYESEIQKTTDDPSTHKRGIGYRLLALDAGERGEPFEQQLELLRKSEEILTGVSGYIELAKTWADMARLYRAAGDMDRARQLATKSHGVLARSAPALFPDDLSPLVDNKATYERTSIRPMVNGLVDALSRLPAPLSQQELHSRVVTIICALFGAERAGLFMRRDNGVLSLVSSYNILSLGEEKALEQINRSFAVDEPILTGASSDDPESATVLCIPLKIAHVTLVLYLTASGAMDILDELSEEQTVWLAGHAGKLLSMFLGYTTATEDAYRQNMGLVTSGRTATENELLYRSSSMDKVMHTAGLAAQSDVSVIILGETGVGKELMARHIHRQSGRRDMPFVTVDLTTLPESLVESELFGHEKGSFTGANEQRTGQIGLADKGTLFIDEIGDAPLAVQLKLLRVLQERTYRRVGGTKVLHSDFRLIVATNKDLHAEMREGRFREDLYYRLNVITLLIPPLRDRKEDIIHLANHFLAFSSRKYAKPMPVLTRSHENALMAHAWPGNVREMKNLMERVIVLQDDSLLYLDRANPTPRKSAPPTTGARPAPGTLDEAQVEHITRVLEQTKGRVGGKNGAAVVLGLKRSTLYNRMKKLGMV